MNIKIIPLNSVRAFVDVETSEIFISHSELEGDPTGLLQHELAHAVSGDPDHGARWAEYLHVEPMVNDDFKILRKRVGIPTKIAANLGSIVSTPQLLVDYHLLESYRRNVGKFLGTEGHWEVINERNGGPGDQLIRLYPTPKGSFPVVVLYYPVVTQFRSPQAKLLASKMLLAEAKIMLGNVRRKLAGIPSPDGGTITLDGESLVSEGNEEKKAITEEAIYLGEPLGVYKW